MGMDEKCELASAFVDYMWYQVLRKTDPHTIEKKDGEGWTSYYYTEEAQDLFNNVLDIIDDKFKEEV